MDHANPRIEAIDGQPEFLSFGSWKRDGQSVEVASRRKLDTRQVVPYFTHEGVLYVGVLERERPSRLLRGAPIKGWEPIGFDFAGVDETADILHYGRAIFSERAHVKIDENSLKIALPSIARSIGYLTEFALPLLVGIHPPDSLDVPVAWDGGEHRVLFRPLGEMLQSLRSTDAPPHGEDLAILLHALQQPSVRIAHPGSQLSGASEFLDRNAHRVLTASQLAKSIFTHRTPEGFAHSSALRGDDLRFLKARRVFHNQHWIEVVSPGSSVSFAMLPYVFVNGVPWFLLWRESRASVLERQSLQPLFDMPVASEHINATAAFLSAQQASALAQSNQSRVAHDLATDLLSGAFGHKIAVISVESIGSPAEPCPSTSDELRYRTLCQLDPRSIGELPPDVFLISATELSHAVSLGWVRDPVIVSGLAELGSVWNVDPFSQARSGEVPIRLEFLNTMTQGSIVQRRLKTYSSIEVEQLEAPTYARLMTLLQHEYGVRVAYPRDESDRSFFKAAFRVFMAADREENRALQGLHWSHDAFHFALGNFTPAPTLDLLSWYRDGGAMPDEVPPEGEAFETYYSALKAAENEATFFSFWTLYSEKLSLARFVGKLTFFEALREMGITDRAGAREIFDAVTHRAELPTSISGHPVYQSREDVRGLFGYMLGFRDYHRKDIKIAWKYASREPYRAIFIRFGIYDHDLAKYVAGVKSFQTRLDQYLPGLNPLLAAWADTRVAVCLRVWDAVKALKLVRPATPQADVRTQFFSRVEETLVTLEAIQTDLFATRTMIEHAEITPRNEEIYGSLQKLGARLESARAELWDRVALTGLISAEVLHNERIRELPK